MLPDARLVPEGFTNKNKIKRVNLFSWILHGLSLYRNMKEGDPRPIETCSPSEVRRLLFRVLKETKALQLTYRNLDKRVLENLEEEG